MRVKRWLGGLGVALFGGAALAVLHAAQAEESRSTEQGPRTVYAHHALGVPLHPCERCNEVSGRLPDRTAVQVLRWSGDRRWLEVRAPEGAGWIVKRYLSPPSDGRGSPSADRGADIPPSSPWASPGACERVVSAGERASGGDASRGPRIGAWNLHWFPDGTSGPRAGPDEGTDLAWMACIVVWLDVDVLAVQEVKQTLGGRRALLGLLEELEAHTGARWKAELDDCPDDGRQHVGFLWRGDALTLGSVHTVASLNPAGAACAHRLRPGVAARAQWSGGTDVTLVGLHLDSGTSARDYRHRRASVERLGRVVQRMSADTGDPDVVVAGDFNTMGCKRCTPSVTAERELRDMQEALGRAGLRRLESTEPCTQYYRGRGSSLDHIVTSGSLAGPGRVARVEVHGPCAELECASPSGPRARRVLARLSDHCPLVLELSGGGGASP